MSPQFTPAILILEDDQGIGQLIRKRLEREGLTAVVAPTAVDAFQMIADYSNIEIVVCDYNLGPGEANGLEVFKKLRYQSPNLSAVLITGITTEKLLIDSIRLGIRDYVPKNEEFLDTLTLVIKNLVVEKSRERKFREIEQLAGHHNESSLALDAADLFWINWEIPADRITFSERLKELSPSLTNAKSFREFLQVVHGDERRTVLRTIARARLHPKEIVEARFRIGNESSPVWVRARGKYHRGAGNLGQFLIVLFDETHTKLRELELKRLNDVSEELASRLSRSMLEIHHRVKNSFQIVISLLNMELRNKGKLERVDVERVVSYLQGLAVIHDMLTDQAKNRDADGLVDIAALIRNIALTISPAIDRVQLNLLEDDARMIQRVASSLAVVVTELLLNAFKYGSEESVELILSTTQEKDKRRLTIRNRLMESSKNNSLIGESSKGSGTGHSLINFLVKTDLGSELVIKDSPKTFEAEFLIPITFPTQRALQKAS